MYINPKMKIVPVNTLLVTCSAFFKQGSLCVWPVFWDLHLQSSQTSPSKWNSSVRQKDHYSAGFCGNVFENQRNVEYLHPDPLNTGKDSFIYSPACRTPSSLDAPSPGNTFWFLKIRFINIYIYIYIFLRRHLNSDQLTSHRGKTVNCCNVCGAYHQGVRRVGDSKMPLSFPYDTMLRSRCALGNNAWM